MASPKNIIAVGGGKGGIGKSVVCANLAVGLAVSGHNVVLVDTDYGASNLHALLGISNPKYGFQDLLAQKDSNPSSLLLDTGIDNLKFLSGAGDIAGSADIGPSHVKKIISIIKNLNVDTAIMDLGPGISFKVVDYFNVGNQNVTITLPEMPSVMNAFSFLKAALFRRLHSAFQNRPDILSLLDQSTNFEVDNEVHSIDQFREKLAEKAPEEIETANSIVDAFKPGLIVNRVRRKKDILLGENLIKLARKYLDIELKYLGYIVESDRVRESVEEMVPFLIKDPQSKPSENLQQIIGALTQSDLHLVKKDGMIFVSKQVRLSSSWNI
ncbi:MAG: P-loop NTPase [Nitrospinae bacterium]|nr:P-loop NTPase [Nitrospinota bacterium]